METSTSLLPDPVQGALSRAVALRFLPDSLVQGGTGLDLSIRPTASASQRLLDPSQAVAVSATALGLGFGDSRFYADSDNSSFFSSPRLTLLTGGGRIAGQASATASALGASRTAADAEAINVAIANTNLLSRGGDPLWIGSVRNPFLAEATAAGRALSIAAGSSTSAAQLMATARVRGLEGSPAADLTPLPSFEGQPNAVVEAVARLKPADGSPVDAGSSALADAKGLEGYRVLALSALSGPSQVAGVATARVAEPDGLSQTSAGPRLSAQAIGIDNSLILGPALGALQVVGNGNAWLDQAPGSLTKLSGTPGPADGATLQGLGIHASTLMANGGDVQVVGLGDGGLATQGLDGGAASATIPVDAAGIDRSTIVTGQGNDRVQGVSLVKDSFDGIRDSTVETGAGRDVIEGSSNGSLLDAGQGDDTIQLIRSRNSFLEGGFGADTISVGKGSQGNQLEGGFGNDNLQVVGGSLNRLDGGFGQDQLIARDGTGDTFVQSEAGAALRAADSRGYAEQLTDPQFWSSLSDAERRTLWSSGEWPGRTSAGATPPSPYVAGHVDVIQGFDPGRGDKLELSSSLAGITQDLWDQQGTLFTISNDHLQRPVSGAAAPSAFQPGAIGVVVGSLAAIRSLGIGAPTIAYATDTHQLMFDADGDWSKGSLSIGSVTMAESAAALDKGDIRFNA